MREGRAIDIPSGINIAQGHSLMCVTNLNDSKSVNALREKFVWLLFVEILRSGYNYLLYEKKIPEYKRTG